MLEAMNKAVNLMGSIGFLSEQVLAISALKDRLFKRELIVSVVGQFKRGKSSLINVLLNDELLPVGIVPLTTVVTEIRRADRFRALVKYFNGSEREIGRTELPEYISEQKNKGNLKNVSSVKLWTQHVPFGSNVTLVDTLGVGSVHQHNTETSYSYVEKSDAVLFLLSVDSPVSQIEKDFLLKVREHAAKFYFVVNKIDAVSEENLEQFLSYCQDLLSEALDTRVTLYPLSAKTGGGVSAFAKKLASDLGSSFDHLLEASLLQNFRAIVEQVKAKLNIFLKAAAIPFGEFQAKAAQIREKQASLTSLADEVHVLTKQKTDRLVEDIRGRLDVKTLEVRVTIDSQAKQLCGVLRSLPSRQFEERLFTGFKKILRENLTQLNAEDMAILHEGYARIVNELNQKAIEVSLFVSNMVKDQFGQEYPVSVRDFTVSERSDFFLKFSQSSSLLLDPRAFTHLLPRTRANKIIYERSIGQLFDDLDRNKNNMIYNYGYKMQESLRTLLSEFTSDVIRMNTELEQLLCHAEKERKARGDKLSKTEDQFRILLQQLDGLLRSLPRGAGPWNGAG